MRNLRLQTHIPRRRLQVTRDSIPRNPPLRQMIERREPPCKQERVLVRRGRGDPEREVLGYGGHRGYGEKGVRDGDLGDAREARVEVGGALVDVVGA